jgi:HlyD family secretion protein
VTYDVVIDVANPKLLLKPGMTADVAIVVESVTEALMIPNVALRFAPPETSSVEAQAHDEAIADMGSAEDRSAGHLSQSPDHRLSVWIPDKNGAPKKVMLSIGLVDDRFSEIKDGPLKVGELVLIGIDRESDENHGRRLPPWFR